jgi:hypothetical protein
MVETKFGPLKALVGRTFHALGQLSVTVAEVTDRHVVTLDMTGPFKCPRAEFRRWLAGAEEVKDL